MRSRVPLVAAVAVGLALLAAPAATPAAAASAPVLRQSDLPAGYRLAGPPERERDAVAKFPSVAGSTDSCYLNPEATLSGARARIDSVTFTRGTQGTGGESVWTFPSESVAEAFFDQYARTLTGLPKCTAVRYDDDDDDATPPVPLGTYDRVDIGKVGDERAAVALQRAGAGIEPMTAVFRTGSRVVLVQVDDARMTAPEFRDLVLEAEDRAG